MKLYYAGLLCLILFGILAISNSWYAVFPALVVGWIFGKIVHRGMKEE